MDSVEFEFPLTKLALLAREHVYRTMEPFDRIASTFSSKRVKKEIKGLRLNYGDVMTINLDSGDILFCPDYYLYGFYRLQFVHPDRFLESESSVTGFLGDPVTGDDVVSVHRDWEFPEINGIGWINHFIDIFRIRKIILSFMENCQNSPVADLLQCFSAIEVQEFQVIHDEIPLDYLQDALEAFPTKKYMFNQDPFEDRATLHAFLSSGFDDITILFPLNLTDIQVMTCPVAVVDRPTFNDIDMNVFLRIWMAGWNTSLKQLIVWFNRDSLSENYDTTMLRRLEHNLVEEQRTFEIPGGGQRVFPYGYDLVRSDGMRATLFNWELLNEDTGTLRVVMHFFVCP